MNFEELLTQFESGIKSFENLDLSEEDILGILNDITLRASNFNKSKIIQFAANYSNFENSSISDAEIREAYFVKSNMRNTDFTKSLLMEVYMNSSNLQLAKFDGAAIVQSYFIGADLRKASFKNCILGDVDFSNSNLRGANFSDTEMTNCKFTDAIQDGIISKNIKSSENIDIFFS